MCGIVGIVSLSGKTVSMDTFFALMREARIRGQHAHGYAYISNGEVVVHTETGPILDTPSIQTNAIIGHCRYSTSDLNYNQPIGDATMAIVHNGVVSQADPAEWERQFGVQCFGRNDTEILLRLMQKGIHPLTVDPSSQACAILTPTELQLWRNEFRPLHYALVDEYLIFASAANIIDRAIGLVSVKQTNPNESITIDLASGAITAKVLKPSKEDMQHAKV